jgi:peptide/nickel transport system permease protein
VFASFFLSHVVPSNPAIIYVGPEARPDEVARVVRQLGLDQSLPVQFWRYLTALLRGDWGTSIATKQPVLHELASRLPATLELLTLAIAAAAVVGTALGVVAARRQGRPIDAAVRLFSIAGVSMPTFWLGLLLQIVASRGSLPVTGRNDVNLQFDDPISRITGFNLIDSLATGNWTALHDTVVHLILPALTLAAYPTGLVARMTRAAMIDTLAQDHTGYARIQGLSERVVVWRLALRNALPTTITVLGLSLAFLLTGTFFVEVIFNWPGIGQFATDSLLNSDYPAIQGITLLGAIGYLLINLVVDLVNARLDPRVRLA